MGELPTERGEPHPGMVTRPGKAARNRVGYMREPLLTADEKPLPAGVYYLETDGDLPRGQRPPRQLLVRADLNVILKASTDEALAWVTDLKTGQPVSGAAGALWGQRQE